MQANDVQRQKAEWKRKGWSIPELRGSKQEWFNIVTELMHLIGSGAVVDLSLFPELNSADISYPWRTYAPLLKGVGLVSNRAGAISLTEIGKSFLISPSRMELASLLHNNYRLVGEVLNLLRKTPQTVEEVDKLLCREYSLD